MKSVCVDLDGTLAYYTEFDDMGGRIGKPRPGAREFLAAIREVARVIIFTCRLSNKYFSEETQQQVLDYLERYELPYDGVYLGLGKPICAAFVDDRNIEIPKNPVEEDYADALVKVRRRLENVTMRARVFEEIR